MCSTGRRHALLALIVGGAFIAWFATVSAFAHPGAGTAWREGMADALSGVDHVIVMIAVGVWAAQIGQRALWVMPTAFLTLVAGGARLAIAGVRLPGADDGIAVSVALLGVLLAVAARPRLATAAAFVGTVGLFHGYVRGAEIPAQARPLLYGCGLLSVSALLPLAGLVLGLAARSRIGQKVMPMTAAAIAGIGVTLVLTL